MKQLIKDLLTSLVVGILLFFLTSLRGNATNKEAALLINVLTPLFVFIEIRFLRKRLTPKQKEV